MKYKCPLMKSGIVGVIQCQFPNKLKKYILLTKRKTIGNCMLSTTDRIPLFVDCIVFKIELFCLLAERWSDRAGGNGTANMASRYGHGYISF